MAHLREIVLKDLTRSDGNTTLNVIELLLETVLIVITPKVLL